MPIGFELANTLFAGISAVAAAVQAWVTYRDRHKAAEAFDSTFKRTAKSPEASAAAEELAAIIPEDVIKGLEARADSCWTGYRKVLGGDYLPDEVDKATKSVQACVCRELKRINTLNGTIPPRWQGQWDRFKCGTHGGPPKILELVKQAPLKIGTHIKEKTKRHSPVRQQERRER